MAIRPHVRRFRQRLTATANQEPSRMVPGCGNDQTFSLQPRPCLADCLGHRLIELWCVISVTVILRKIVVIELGLFLRRQRIEMFKKESGQFFGFER